MWRSLAPPPSSLASSSSLSGGTIGAMECRSSSRYICHLLVAKISQAHSHCCSGVAEPHFTLAWRRRGTRAGGNQSPKCSWMQGLQVGLRKEKKTYAWPIKYFVNIEYYWILQVWRNPLNLFRGAEYLRFQVLPLMAIEQEVVTCFDFTTSIWS